MAIIECLVSLLPLPLKSSRIFSFGIHALIYEFIIIFIYLLFYL